MAYCLDARAGASPPKTNQRVLGFSVGSESENE